MTNKCPGMGRAFFTPNDIKSRPCPSCGAEQEFWKDDVRLTCKKCGNVNINPSLANTCLAWCKNAAQCIGNANIDAWKEGRSGKKLDS